MLRPEHRQELQSIIMHILKTNTASMEDSKRIEDLEALLYEQNSYAKIDHPEYDYIGELIANLLVINKHTEAIDKMYEYDITSKDFFGFINYHDEDEEFYDIFTKEFIENINSQYKSHKVE